jgi:hypothetical protein
MFSEVSHFTSSALFLSSQSTQSQEQEMKCQTGTLSDMADSLRIISQSFETLKATCSISGSLNDQALTAIEATKQILM